MKTFFIVAGTVFSIAAMIRNRMKSNNLSPEGELLLQLWRDNAKKKTFETRRQTTPPGQSVLFFQGKKI